MRLALIFTVAIQILFGTAAAADESPVRARAAVCEDAKCNKAMALFGFAPVSIRVTYSITIHPDNRALAFGLYCTGAEFASVLPLHGDQRRPSGEPFDDPQFIFRYPRVPAGQCQAVAILHRSDGTEYTARSETLTIKSQLGEDE